MAKNLKIITDPDPKLRQVSQEIDIGSVKDPKMQEFFQDLEKTMLENDGVGLASPQVAENIRVIAVKNGQETLCMVNPEITKRSWAKEWGEEGCLSVPEYYGEVSRSKKINCLYWDKKGNKKRIKVQGFPARVIQHEIDHLDGILFTDKAKNLKKSSE
ncbi:MAG TPA: peptide deformylase [Patescibacteria group bacterium]|nr:peptide deformylase [Patescibacteria group bacterium]